MKSVESLLKPNGVLLVMDPHPLWLTPWFGAPDAPLGILTEYRQRRLKSEDSDSGRTVRLSVRKRLSHPPFSGAGHRRGIPENRPARLRLLSRSATVVVHGD